MQTRQDVPWSVIFRRLGLILLGFTITTLIHVTAMVYGWGLEPKSWFWIIGAGIFGMAFVRMFVESLLEGKKQ